MLPSASKVCVLKETSVCCTLYGTLGFKAIHLHWTRMFKSIFMGNDFSCNQWQCTKVSNRQKSNRYELLTDISLTSADD